MKERQWNAIFKESPGALGNGLKQLELSKVGLIAHPMQNEARNWSTQNSWRHYRHLVYHQRLIWSENNSQEGIRVYRY